MCSLSVPLIGRAERPWPGRVLVGFDGSFASAVAIEWAIREVAARGSSLRIGSSAVRSGHFERHTVSEFQEQKLSRLLHNVRDEHPSFVVERAATEGDPRKALIEEAENADLLVLAASTDEAAEAVLPGSLARRAMRRSPCPVVIVRGSRTGPVREIVLGVDGSSASGSALDWACIEANLHRADLLVMYCREGDISRAEAGCVVDLAVNECRERTGVEVRGVLTERSAASALIDASRTADLVAVGSRGRSGFKTAVFGSVALSVAEAADCPVAVIHPSPRA
jgi:nucleotide-binding universal stress UspA family protein